MNLVTSVFVDGQAGVLALVRRLRVDERQRRRRLERQKLVALLLERIFFTQVAFESLELRRHSSRVV